MDERDFPDLLFLYLSAFQLLLQPDIEDDFADSSVKAALVFIQAFFRFLSDPLPQFKQDIKKPGTVFTEQLPFHDHHVEHVSPCLFYRLVEGVQVIGVFFPYDVSTVLV